MIEKKKNQHPHNEKRNTKQKIEIRDNLTIH